VLLDLDLGLLLHVLHDARPPDLALEAAEDEAQPVGHVELLQHLVLVGDAEVHVRRGQVGEAPRVRDVHLEDRRHLVGDAVDERRQRLGRAHDARDERVDGLGVAELVARRRDLGHGERLLLLDGVDGDAAQPLEGDLHRVAGEVDALVHARRDAHAADELDVVHRLVVVAVGDDERDDHARLVVGAQQGEVLRAPICTAIVPSG
jgi:hypothetical protein